MANKILIVGPSWVGDMVMAQSLFKTLKGPPPDCFIDVLAPAWSSDLLAAMPEVNRTLAMPLGHGQFNLPERIRLGKQLRAERYDQAIVLPNSWKSALIPFFAKIPLRTGYIGEARWGLLNDARKLDKKLLPMTVQRFVALALPHSAALPPPYSPPQMLIDDERRRRVLDKFNLASSTLHASNFSTTEDTGVFGKGCDSMDAVTAPTRTYLNQRKVYSSANIKILALCPGAEYGEAKRWPATHFAELARRKIADGWQVWLFGSSKDHSIATQINRLTAGACLDFTGRTTLAEAMDLLSLVDIVVSNDSGLMHVAAALDKIVIALYGSSDTGFTPPLSDKARIISLNLACSPCFKRTCPLGHTDCLQGIKPERVLDLLPP